jgi:hypothetical protein
LGPNSERIDFVTVEWPSGTVQELGNVPPNQVLYLVESGSVPGDYNQDLIVDVADYSVWRNQLGATGSGLAADGNGDNMVTQLDYDVWKGNFGATAIGAGSAAQYELAPEPSTILLLVLGTFLMANLSRRGSSRRRYR